MSKAEPFDQFIAAVAAARPEKYPGIAAADLERNKNYILKHYGHFRPVCSYVDAMGQVVDCFPRDKQPGARAFLEAGGHLAPAETGHRPSPGRTPCPPDTVPQPRITLERLLQLGSPAKYHEKAPPPTSAAHD